MIDSEDLSEKKTEEVMPEEIEVPEVVSQEEAQEETSVAEVTNEQPAETEVALPSAKRTYATKSEVLDRVREIAHSEEYPNKEEVDELKSAFYRLHTAEREAKLKEYIDGGGDPDSYQFVPDELEEHFKAEMSIIKEKRNKQFLEQEAEKQENLKRKQAIIERIKEMTTSPEMANKSYQEFKQLQQEWKEIKAVPAESANELWRNYQLYVEQFYDLLKLNSEAREYDFKKNLGLKTHLCEAAEKLAEETDVVSAFHQLQELHQQYREIGPVAKELREEIWGRFKAASTVINKRHQQHFERLRSMEQENLNRKTALCEQVEAIAGEENKAASDWEKHAKQIIEIQKEWKTIGFAPQKMNVKIFERFRTACDDFFTQKTLFFKELKEKFHENAEKKRALIERAQALKDSTEWKATSDKFIALQKEWKAVGMVPKKLGDKLWAEFLAACNHFFEARNAAGGNPYAAERENLEKKRNIITRLHELAEQKTEEVEEQVHNLIDEYNAVGHVPFKEKDKLYKEYHDILDKLQKELNISAARRKLDQFKTAIKNAAQRGEDALGNERARLFRHYEGLKQEIQTYENNLGFLNASSKKGNSLLDEVHRKIQRLKDEMELVRQKIKTIDEEQKDGE
ncbi:DUF349 domain-containing protein [Hoylesella marshii]|uniref:DUF349 domain-containing protein n=1 Tax=Hoylesella marshii DSM 16973 = JCM 13450 TaxID=862515 RepID=E0NRT1_9BACT|nr:DUF349 domain-containing protein [Hoylesella marshii]EFM02219.1 hypothetical protein HMPREF0658_0882 [Hoylesella marshii DSM 16973 = JCM 13450]